MIRRITDGSQTGDGDNEFYEVSPLRPFLFYTVACIMVILIIFPEGETFAQNKDVPVIQGFSQHPSLRPSILSVISEINPDSLKKTMQKLQEFGSRYKLLPNRKQIAEWLVSRFGSYGMTEVEIDSFFCHVKLPFDTSLWQYNVVARITGSSASEEEDILGAHYDSYSQTNILTNAPGADDNASGVAAVLEIARAMKHEGYSPESTIMFALFAAEEFGGQGSEYMAKSSREAGRDIRYMINLDMIANDPDTAQGVNIYRFFGFEPAGRLAVNATELYTGLAASLPEDSTNTDSDSYFFWLYGFPTTFFTETHFSPNWHTSHDTLGACNIRYCADVARSACAALMEDQFLPWPRSFTARSSKGPVSLSWSATRNSNVIGYDLYRSQPPDTVFERINPKLLTEPSFTDLAAARGTEYHYCLKTINDSLEESISSGEARGIMYSFKDTLLVLSSIPNNSATPDSIFRFYENVLDTIPFEWHDVNRQNPLTLAELGTHRNVWWMANVFNYTPLLRPSVEEMGDFFGCGGNMMITAFLPGSLMDNLQDKTTRLNAGSVLHDYFKADSVIRKPTAFMYQAYPAFPGLDTLSLDPEKQRVHGFPGQLQNIETYSPDTEGTVIYRFDSRYSSTSSMGILQDRPVGLAYNGSLYKTILLSFPLYYLDTGDARNFVHQVVGKIFTNPSHIHEYHRRNDNLLMQNFPNPFSGSTTISLFLPETSEIILMVYSISGARAAELFRGRMKAGSHSFRFSAEDLPPGIYKLVLICGNQVLSRNMILLE